MGDRLVLTGDEIEMNLSKMLNIIQILEETQVIQKRAALFWTKTYQNMKAEDKGRQESGAA